MSSRRTRKVIRAFVFLIIRLFVANIPGLLDLFVPNIPGCARFAAYERRRTEPEQAQIAVTSRDLKL
jgi:hypothetical protein